MGHARSFIRQSVQMQAYFGASGPLRQEQFTREPTRAPSALCPSVPFFEEDLEAGVLNFGLVPLFRKPGYNTVYCFVEFAHPRYAFLHNALNLALDAEALLKPNLWILAISILLQETAVVICTSCFSCTLVCCRVGRQAPFPSSPTLTCKPN